VKQSVLGIIFNKDKTKVLIIKRRDVPVWVFPGGGVDKNEDLKSATIREIKEETGLDVEIIKKIGEYQPLNRLTRYMHLFECKIIDGELTTGMETSAIDFFPIQNLPNPFFHIHRDMLKDALSNDPTVIKKTLTQVTYLELIKYFIRHPIRVIRFALSQLGFPINDP